MRRSRVGSGLLSTKGMRDSQEGSTMNGRHGIRRILAPTDFSDGALSAVDYAKLLAKRFGAGITLLHAASPRPMFDPLPLIGISFVETLDESERAAATLETYRAEHL